MDSNAASTGSIQEGHVNDLTSQSSMQSLWYICIHGRNRIGSPTAKSDMQITHLPRRIKNKITLIINSISVKHWSWTSPSTIRLHVCCTYESCKWTSTKQQIEILGTMNGPGESVYHTVDSTSLMDWAFGWISCLLKDFSLGSLSSNTSALNFIGILVCLSP